MSKKFWTRFELVMRFVPVAIFFGVGIPASQFNSIVWFYTMIGLIAISVVAWEVVQRSNTKRFGVPTY